MRYIVDAQLPYLLAEVLRQRGYDVIHADDLPDKERTGDQSIRQLSAHEDRIVITKDADFQDTYFLYKQPPRLLLLTTGNIKNRQLLNLFRRNIAVINDLFDQHTFVELNNDEYIIHD